MKHRAQTQRRVAAVLAAACGIDYRTAARWMDAPLSVRPSVRVALERECRRRKFPMRRELVECWKYQP